jgi:uroporphyrinogen-III synthase
VRVLVTRAEPGAADTARRLAALGHEALIAPMLRIEIAPDPVSLNDARAILFTSTNGVRALSVLSSARPESFCVGEATAEAARAAGFSPVHSADGDLNALASLVATTLHPADGNLFHAAGADLAGDLAGLLRARGFDVRVHTCYRAVEADALEADIEEALATSAVDAVMFHSARGVAAFVKLAKRLPTTARIDALCLSEAVADAARASPWRRVLSAKAPRESELLSLLGPADFARDSGQDSA